ncbi:9007_t:CDS:2, partial [Acaulospora morrowiae]
FNGIEQWNLYSIDSIGSIVAQHVILGEKPPYKLIPYIEVLSIQVNKFNKAAVYKACIKKLGKELFVELYIEEERAKILYASNEENQQMDISSIITSNNLEVFALFRFLNPNISLPGCHVLAGHILSSHSEELQRKQAINAKKEEVGNTLAFDGLKNEAEDISGDGTCTIDVVEKIKSFFVHAERDDVKIIAVVTDNTSAYASARLVENVVRVQRYCFSALLCTPSKLTTGTYLGLKICNKRALKALALYYQELHICIITHLEDNEWWQMIEELESHLFPFMAILNHLQYDVVWLSDVLHAFAYFMQLYKDREDSFSKNMIQYIESLWKQWE